MSAEVIKFVHNLFADQMNRI